MSATQMMSGTVGGLRGPGGELDTAAAEAALQPFVDQVVEIETNLDAALANLQMHFDYSGSYFEGVEFAIMSPAGKPLMYIDDYGAQFGQAAITVGGVLSGAYDPVSGKYVVSYGTTEADGFPIGFGCKLQVANYYEGITVAQVSPNGKPVSIVYESSDIATGLSDRMASAEINIAALQTQVGVTIDAAGMPISHIMNQRYLREFAYRRSQILDDAAATVIQLALAPADSYTRFRTWARNMARKLKAELGNAGFGWTGVGYPPAIDTGGGGNAARAANAQGNVDPSEMSFTFYGAGWTGNWMGAQGSPDCCSATTSTVGDGMTFTYNGSAPITAIGAHYLGGTGVSRYRFNGGAWTDITMSGSDGQVTPLTGIPAGNGWTLDWELVSGAGSFFGISGRTAATSGIVIHNLAVSGSDLARWSGTFQVDPAGWRASSAAAFARLGTINVFVCPIGTNDQTYGRTYDSYQTSMAAWIDGVGRVASPGCDILWVCAPENGRGAAELMSEFTKRAKLVAVQKQVALLDLQPLFGNNYNEYGETGTLRQLIGVSGDKLHPTDPGGALYRNAIRNALNDRS